VSVDRDEQDARRFWSAVLDALRSPAASVDPETQPAATAALDVDQLVDRVLSELADQVEPAVLIIDDLHELRSADALAQLEHLLAILPSSARVVLSSRRDPPIRLHRLRLADEVAEIRAGDLRFTESETRELLAGSRISFCSTRKETHPTNPPTRRWPRPGARSSGWPGTAHRDRSGGPAFQLLVPTHPDRHLQGVQGQLGMKRGGDPPAHDGAAEGVDDEGHIDEPGPGVDVGQIRDPEPVGCWCSEVPID
jgi:hypothetical protein